MDTKIAMLIAGLVFAAPAASAVPRSPQTGGTGSAEASDETAAAEYERRARLLLRDLRDELDAAQDDAATLTGQAREKAAKHAAVLRKRSEEAERELLKLRRTGELKAQKARQRLDSVIEALRREYEGLRRDLEEKEAD